MRFVERSPISGEASSISILDRLQGIWRFGYSWDQDVQSQHTLVEKLGAVLDNSYTLVSNVTIPGVSLPVPLVLIGPSGVHTLYTSAVKGIFRLKGENWYKLDEKNESYKASRPNLARRTLLMSRAVIEYLKEKGYYLEENETVLFFAHPATYIDASDPPLRLLQADGVEAYAMDLADGGIALDAREIQHVAELLAQSRVSRPKRDEDLRSLKPPAETIGFGEFQLKVWQWILLFVLTVLMLITVIVTAVIIVSAF
ncbi:MAG: hypothetical protein JSV42_12005 [Chloroflexota bacterium]|nr:MAG: hypothetical protein JSV42_12005 [Chloroflexota bacterium]